MSDRPRILVAEDDSGIRALIRTRLEMTGYEAHIARNGVEAVSRVIELRPRALVLDINMPEMDGFGVLKTLGERSDVQLPNTLVLTARHAAEDVKRAVALGAKDYLTKPFSEKQLLARVARLLRAPPRPPTAEPPPHEPAPPAATSHNDVML